MKTCNGCGACCSVMPVKEIGLAEYTWCKHLGGAHEKGGVGCRIYETRPYSCRAWSCEWLKSDWPTEMRPDRFGVIVDENRDLIRVNGQEMPAAQLWALPGHEDDFKRDEVNGLICTIIEDQGLAVVWHMKGGVARVFLRDPKTGQIGMSAPQSATSNADDILGPVGARMWRAETLAAKFNGTKSATKARRGSENAR